MKSRDKFGHIKRSKNETTPNLDFSDVQKYIRNLSINKKNANNEKFSGNIIIMAKYFKYLNA